MQVPVLFRAAIATKASKAWALPKFWVSIRSYRNNPTIKFGVEYWALPCSNSTDLITA